MSIQYLAKKLPYPIKQGLKHIYGAIPPSMRYSKIFWETYTFLQKSQWWSREKLEEYQMRQLSKLLYHAYENTPYYRRIFDEGELKPKDIKSLNDFKKLPYLTKDVFKENFNDFIASNINVSKLTMTHTSGSTGKPIQFYRDLNEDQKEWAFVCHQWSRVGHKPGDPRIEVRGAVITGDKPFCYDPVTKVLRLSPRIDSKEIAILYLEKIRSLGAKFIHGYPSCIALFAFMIKQYNLSNILKLKAILFASETVYPWQRQIVEEIFGRRVFSFYGMTEHVVMAGECENNTSYHCIPQYGITEIKPVSNEIVGTSFINYANPFIRYCTTDIASVPVGSGCNECGRQYFHVFPNVAGRLEDFIITPEGIPVSPAVITHPFKDLKTIKSTQIVQKSSDCIKLTVVPCDGYSSEIIENELQQLCQGLKGILSSDMKIQTEIAESIPLSKSGNFKWVVSEISKGFLEKGIRKI